ncbi:MAG: IS4 family transposase [Methyloligellaceae bacterium]
MPFIPTAFHRLLEPLDRRVLARIVNDHQGNHGVGEGEGAWTCQRHLKALLFAQFAGLGSLREIEQALSARPAALYHLGLIQPKRSTLSDASATRPAAVFRDLGQHLMAVMTRKLRREGEALIQLLDASPIPLKDIRFAWPEASARTRGLKLYIHYDPSAGHPTQFAITSPKTSDIALARPQTIQAGTTYVFDKGFTDYSWWHDIDEAGALFVTRLKKNARRRNVTPSFHRTEEAILADTSFKLGHKKPRGSADNPLYDTVLREITVSRDGKEPLHLVTNDFSRSAREIAELYKKRWQIELFFKWIKQNLKIKIFLGRSENAVKIQIYVALIAFLLLKWLKTKHVKSHKVSPKILMARLKVALLNPIDLTNRTKPPPTSPRLRPPKHQLKLKLL